MPLNLFGALMPREESFTRLFCEQSKTVVVAAEALHRFMIEGDGAVDRRVGEISAIEVEADAVARKIFIAANRTFNAPLDREDILGLARDMDDIVDLIEEAAKEIRRYEVRTFSTEMIALAEAAVRCAGLLRDAMPLLDAITRDHRKLLALCERIGRIEDDADHCFDDGLNALRVQLREGALDAIGYIDRKEIYGYLEEIVDRCDDAANAIETIVAKHV
jgi:predicted phosphate transport protein (TIGR00153 family)